MSSKKKAKKVVKFNEDLKLIQDIRNEKLLKGDPQLRKFKEDLNEMFEDTVKVANYETFSAARLSEEISLLKEHIKFLKEREYLIEYGLLTKNELLKLEKDLVSLKKLLRRKKGLETIKPKSGEEPWIELAHRQSSVGVPLLGQHSALRARAMKDLLLTIYTELNRSKATDENCLKIVDKYLNDPMTLYYSLKTVYGEGIRKYKKYFEALNTDSTKEPSDLRTNPRTSLRDKSSVGAPSIPSDLRTNPRTLSRDTSSVGAPSIPSDLRTNPRTLLRDTSSVGPLSLIEEPSSTVQNWTCKLCTLINKNQFEECEVCFEPRTSLAPLSLIEEPSEPSSTVQNWICKLCTSMNKNQFEECEVCLKPRTLSRPEPKWMCKYCSLKNENFREECLNCCTPKDGQRKYRSIDTKKKTKSKKTSKKTSKKKSKKKSKKTSKKSKKKNTKLSKKKKVIYR